jgi:hypothetical protein
MEKSQLYYVCRNKFCTYYAEKTPFQLDIRDEGTEIKNCPKCGESNIVVMDPQPTPGAGIRKEKPNYKMFGIIGVVSIILIVVAIFLFTGKKEPVQKTQEPEQVVQQIPQPENTPIQAEPAKIEEPVKQEQATDEPVVKEPVKPKETVTSSSTPAGTQTKNFDDGSKYVGEMKNEKMHGLGTYYYKERQQISPKDLKKRFAEAGDYLIGEFYEGNVVSGKLFSGDNKLKEVIVIGR